MNGDPRQSAQLSPTERTGCLAGILRAFWMGLGNFALFFAAVAAARRTAPSALDAVYLGIVLLLIVVRYVDITRFRGKTADYEPATLAHWRRYVLGLVPIAAGIWALMRFAHARGLL